MVAPASSSPPGLCRWPDHLISWPPLSTLAALTLIALALFVGGLLLRRLPASVVTLVGVIVVFGLGIPAIVIDENRAETGGGGGEETPAAGGEAEGGGGEEPAGGGGGEEAGGGGAAAEGKLIFTQNCGTCHVLQDAGTSGQVGPPLDPIKPNKQRVLAAIEKGGTGSGTMPANIVTGKEAEAVAEYVASVAGK
jgi:mono/diheme cytochrome c family protein